MHTLHSSADRMNNTCLFLPSQSWSSFTDPGGMEDGWLLERFMSEVTCYCNYSLAYGRELEFVSCLALRICGMFFLSFLLTPVFIYRPCQN